MKNKRVDSFGKFDLTVLFCFFPVPMGRLVLDSVGAVAREG